MSKAVDFLREAGPFYIATDDSGQPRVRPFGAVIDFEGKVYLCTNKQKAVFKQLIANPRVEICACVEGGRWIRITGVAVVDDRDVAKEAMFEAYPNVRRMYSDGASLFAPFYLKDAMATVASHGTEPETWAL